MKRYAAVLAIMAASALLPAQAATITFDSVAEQPLAGLVLDSGQSFNDQGLTFTYGGGSNLYVWDAASFGAAPGTNGTNAVLVGSGPRDALTITRTGGGAFSLQSLSLAISFTDPTTLADAVTINGAAQAITSTAATYALNLLGVTSVTITGLASGNGFFMADDINFNLDVSVPEPASLALLAAGLAGFGLVRRPRGAKPGGEAAC